MAAVREQRAGGEQLWQSKVKTMHIPAHIVGVVKAEGVRWENETAIILQHNFRLEHHRLSDSHPAKTWDGSSVLAHRMGSILLCFGT